MSELQKVKILLLADVISTLVAIVALVLSVLAFQAQTSTLHRGRVEGRSDICHVIKSLFYGAVSPHTGKRARLNDVFSHSELANCYTFAHTIPRERKK